MNRKAGPTTSRRNEPTISRVAVVGTGVVGRSWARLFAEAGCETHLHDPDPGQLERAAEWLAASLDQDVADGLIQPDRAAEVRARVTTYSHLADALAEAEYVQESGPENLEAKRAIFGKLDAAADPEAILATSTSTLDVTKIAAELPGAPRCLVAHPVNPPHVVPIVEILPGVATTEEVTARAEAFLASVGQTPVRLKRYVKGFLLNRMQAALLREAIDLVTGGVADVEAVDAVIREGLGLRWALLGPFGVANTNADGGLREYLERYGPSYRELMVDLGPTPSLDRETIEHLGAGTDAMEGNASPETVRRWRDRMVGRIRRAKAEDPHP